MSIRQITPITDQTTTQTEGQRIGVENISGYQPIGESEGVKQRKRRTCKRMQRMTEARRGRQIRKRRKLGKGIRDVD